MPVVGIDPSLTCTALVSLDVGVPDAEVIPRVRRIMSKTRGCERLEEIREQVIAFLDDEMPSVVIIEGFAYNAKGASVFEMGGLGWLLRWTFHKMQQPYVVVPPNVLKSYATGAGNSSKEIMLREVFRKWKYEAVDNNDADAFALAKFGVEFVQSRDSWTKKFSALVKGCEVVR